MPHAPTVVVPTLDEAVHLPRLLGALEAQTLPPIAVVVADAASSDSTAEIARRAGCKVVAGGSPAVGRNAGAAVVRTDTVLFLDADVVPRPDFIQRAMEQFESRGLDVATCALEPLEPGFTGRLITPVANGYLRAIWRISPHAPGCCILARMDVHRMIGGFDEEAVLAEDHDYVRRAARVGRFALLKGLRMPYSIRRWKRESLLLLTAKTIWCETRVLTGRPIHSAPFEYVFGTQGRKPARPGRRPVVGEE